MKYKSQLILSTCCILGLVMFSGCESSGTQTSNPAEANNTQNPARTNIDEPKPMLQNQIPIPDPNRTPKEPQSHTVQHKDSFDRCLRLSIGFKIVDVERYQKTRAEFNELYIVWAHKTQEPKILVQSNPFNYFDMIPEGLEIIKMGRPALPFVMERICAGNFFFNVAAERITGIDSIRNEAYESILTSGEQNVSILWLDWWEENCNKPEWNVYLTKQTDTNP